MDNQTSSDKYESFRKAIAMGRKYPEGCSILRLLCDVRINDGVVMYVEHETSTPDRAVAVLCGASDRGNRPPATTGAFEDVTFIRNVMLCDGAYFHPKYLESEPFIGDCPKDQHGFNKYFERIFDAAEACGATVELGKCNEVSFNIRIYWKGKKA